MRRTLQLAGTVTLTFLLGACSSSKSEDAAASADQTTGTAPDGTPLCGSDPDNQPDRCLDAQGALRCKVDTGFAGDELALCALDPEEGQIIHFGPKDYSDPEEVANFVLPAGGEDEFCMYVNTTNEELRYFNGYHGRMRPNSHHLIVTMPEQHQDDSAAPWSCGPQVLDRWLFGSQDPQIDVGLGSDPTYPEPGDPDFGLAHDVPAKQTLLIDFHNLNTSDQPELREAWAALNYTPEEDVLVHADLMGFYNIGINIPPRQHMVTSRVTCETPKNAAGEAQDVYVNLMTGHAHQRMKRFSVWHDTPAGSELVYETRDWLEPGNAIYRDGVANPPLPGPTDRWGAFSGYLKVNAGEALSFECEFENDLDQTVTIGETSKDEMCNVFGNYFPSVGGMWNCFGG